MKPRLSRVELPVTLALLTALISGCAPGAPAVPTATTATLSTPTQGPAPAASPSASADPAPLAIDPGDVDPEPPLELIWQGAEPSVETVPFHPSIDLQGRIWVGATGQNRFLLFDRDGEFIESWGTAGSGDGELNFMLGPFGGIAIASDGGFYVSDSANRRVQKFTREREFVTAWGSFGTGDDQFLTPNEIAVDGDDNVYVHDDGLAVTKMFTSDGEFVRAYAEGSGPFICVTPDGHVFAQMWPSNVLNEYGPDGILVRSIDLTGLVALPRAGGVEVDDDGHIWISSVTEEGSRDDADKLIELDRDGTLLHRWDGMAITQFAIDPEGDRLYAAFWQQPFLAAYAIPAD